MPRYRYRCSNCDDERVLFHGFDEAPPLSCTSCLSENTLQKVVGTLYFKTKENNNTDGQPVGQLTKEYIEENRKILDEEKKKLRNKNYEPS